MYKIVVLFNKGNQVYNIDFNRSYSLYEAVHLVKRIRASGSSAELFAEEYAIPLVSENQAWDIAASEYNKVRGARPYSYGDLVMGVHTPVYYSFYCRDFEKEAAGMSPGRKLFRIDKLTGKLLSNEDAKAYSKLNYSF